MQTRQQCLSKKHEERVAKVHKSLRLLVLALVLLPVTTVMPAVGATNGTAVERPTVAVAQGVIRTNALAWVAKNLSADVTAKIVFLKFKLGATRRSTTADYDMTRWPRLPRVGTWVTPVSTEYELRMVRMVDYNGEPRKFCTTWRTTIAGGRSAAILYKRNGKWVERTPIHRWNRTREVHKGLC